MAICPNNTIVEESDDLRLVTLHDTTIVQHHILEDRVVLNSGGWKTVTTKARMNQVFDEWELDLRVYQDSWHWYVTMPDGTSIPFTDNMEINL